MRVEGEVKAEAPARRAALQPPTEGVATSSGASAGLPDLREFIRGRRAALFGFMEQGAALALKGDVLTIIPRNDIYIRYLADNRGVIADLASELYGRRIRAELAPLGTALPPAASAAGGSAVPATEGDADAPTLPAASASPSAAGGVGTGVAGAHPARTPNEDAQSANGAGHADLLPTNEGAVVMSQADLRQTVYADPVVRRIFDEFEARLVEVRTLPSAADSASRKP